MYVGNVVVRGGGMGEKDMIGGANNAVITNRPHPALFFIS